MKYKVRGYALGPMEVTYEIVAKTPADAKRIAENRFKKGDHGFLEYANDDGACCDFEALTADPM